MGWTEQVSFNTLIPLLRTEKGRAVESTNKEKAIGVFYPFLKDPGLELLNWTFVADGLFNDP